MKRRLIGTTVGVLTALLATGTAWAEGATPAAEAGLSAKTGVVAQGSKDLGPDLAPDARIDIRTETEATAEPASPTATSPEPTRESAAQQALAGTPAAQGQTIATLNSLDVDEVSALGEVTAEQVHVTEATGAPAGGEEALNSAIYRNQVQIGALREAIAANASLTEALAAQDVTPEDVIAAKVESDNRVIIFTHGTAPEGSAPAD